jgi:hypothetical protein
MKEHILHTVCAWCHRLRDPAGEWREVEEVEWSGPRATHGICPDCLERATTRATMPPVVAG